jgi:hypothetical protein
MPVFDTFLDYCSGLNDEPSLSAGQGLATPVRMLDVRLVSPAYQVRLPPFVFRLLHMVTPACETKSWGPEDQLTMSS